ncbi:jasmonate-induced oxygenase 4 isoform X2 [Macadamia integrifolia]|uniref:jasmonate-induced oxygenase 4 isoform X2 n=1 Tax=Macadamia integrifolia TaxID=60698 RepID=UPI001C4EE0B4|nr:jasmonate-induced oxygenase 4 isoform X2 [Macadamia integrifolia]
MEVVGGVPFSIQTIAQSGLFDVPSQYLQPPESRPGFCHESSDSSIPVVNLFHCETKQLGNVHKELSCACSEWGAFQVINHGVPKQLLDCMRSAGLSFFKELSEEKRDKYRCDLNSAASEGYGSKMLMKEDSVLDWRVYFDHHTLPLSRRNPIRWPDSHPNYRETVVEYSEHMMTLAQKLLSLISESLGLPSSCMEEALGEIYQNITVSFYPSCPQPELTLGLQAHSDMGAITLLIQDDVAGLQVLKDDQWLTVRPLSDAIVVLLADQTELNGGCNMEETQTTCLK